MDYSKSAIVSALTKKHYTIYEGNILNLIGIRKDLEYTNKFDDRFCVFTDNIFLIFDCTTDAGMYYTKNFSNPRGTAVLKPDQYTNSHKIGKHKNDYSALVQARPLTVYRDTNMDTKIDYKEPDTGMFGINIHRANAYSRSIQVDKWSAGCTVFADPFDFKKFMDIVFETRQTSFTYTLIEERDI
jgi:hypothetical protein